jgi:hypothetical protein
MCSVLGLTEHPVDLPPFVLPPNWPLEEILFFCPRRRRGTILVTLAAIFAPSPSCFNSHCFDLCACPAVRQRIWLPKQPPPERCHYIWERDPFPQGEQKLTINNGEKRGEEMRALSLSPPSKYATVAAFCPVALRS